MVKVGIIGGSGLDDPDILEDRKEISVETKYGKPSDALVTGRIKGCDVALVARHGRNHTIMPSNVNYRANIMALKEHGCTHILATTACGSLREDIEPGCLVFVDQFIDRTTKRHSTFYDDGQVCHIPMAEPFCPELRKLLIESAKRLNYKYKPNGTVVTIEGPKFSTKAESKMYRLWGADVVNMSSVPEVVLAREAGLCYAIIAMSTDYDCFLEDRPSVTIDEVLRVMKENAESVKKMFIDVIPMIGYEFCGCQDAIKTSIVK